MLKVMERSKPLSSLLEWTACKKDEGNIAGGVGAVIVERPGTEAHATLSGKESRVGGSLSNGAAVREEEHGSELPSDREGAAIVKVDGDPPGAFEAT